MRRRMMPLLAFVLIAGFWTVSGTSQILEENHYLVYETPFMEAFFGDIELNDQFGFMQTPFVEFDKFANPVMKNFENYWDPGAHQNWYLIDQPTPEWRVDLSNQFGPQRWFVKDARYLVLPAEKISPYSPPPMFFHNHYMCYEVFNGPVMNIPVHLQDQFEAFDTTVMEPVYFCNPCEKWVNGVMYDIVNPDVHLAVYAINPTWWFNMQVTSLDQFGEWAFVVEEAVWLVVPSWKLEAVGDERSSWGEIKQMYR